LRIKNLFIIVIVSTSILSSGLFSQTLSNLERINLLVDASTKEISSATQDTTNSYKLVNKTLNEYNILKTRVVASLSKNGIKIDKDSSLSNKISYTISHAGVEYSDLFRDGLFGEYLMERKFDLMGNYVVIKNGIVIKSNTFEFSRMDTISYNNFAFVENNSLPFTKANVPSEPFLPSIVEPVIVITAVAVTIILLFTVRSK
jgi:hypothetical protein